MRQRIDVIADTQWLRPVSVARAVGIFLLAGLVVLSAIGVALALALRQTATDDAIREARTLTSLVATSVVGPMLRDEALVPGVAYNQLDQTVRERVLGDRIVRVKIWDSTGRIVYSDVPSLVGMSFPLESDEEELFTSGGSSATVSNLTASENMGEKKFGTLLQVYLAVKTPTGQRLMFETYQPYQSITDASRRTWLTSLPVLLGGLVLLYLVQAPLAYRMARRLKHSQDEREALLLASLAASDRERAMIASDLHDGIVQGLSGASYSLSAASGPAWATDPEAARVLANTAADLRRWVRELRSLVVTIIPPQLHVQGLAPSLADLAATLEVRGLTVTVDVRDVECIDETTETLVYRAAQEAVRNILRHSDATTVAMSVARGETAGSGRGADSLVLRVRDDGCGFDTSGNGTRSRGSVGLELLSALVTSHGGALSVKASPGTGTELILRVPLGVKTEPPAQDAAREPAETVVRP